MAYRVKRCGCTCETMVGACGCEDGCRLTIPNPFDIEEGYVNQAAAEAAFDASFDCLGANQSGAGTTADMSTGSNSAEFVAGFDSDTGTPSFKALFAAQMQAGTLAVAWNKSVAGSSVPTTAKLYDMAGSLVDSGSDTGGFTGTFNLTVPSAGNYVVILEGGVTSGSGVLTFTCTLSAGMEICPVRAAYDDGGGTSYVNCEDLP